MLKRFFSPAPLWQETGLTLIRILTGLFMIYHGSEVFDKPKMVDYAKWLTDLHFPSPLFLGYLGKAIELVAGIFLVTGFLTRLAIIPLIATMLIISFGMGKGKIFMDDQHPFLFVLLFLVLFFTGPGKFSLDYIFFRNKNL
ncbi:MAG: DoxX family protein [Bacteroidota bacterium]